MLYARFDVIILHFAIHKSLCTGTRTSSNKHINVNEVEHRQAGEIRSFRKLCTPHTPCCVIFCILSHICDISRIWVKYRKGWLYSLFEWRKWNSPSLSYLDYVEEISKRRPHKVEILLIQFQLIPCKTFISLLEKF